MTPNDQIEIPLSKKKNALMLLGSIVFVGIGAWLILNPPDINNPYLKNPTLIFISGIASILFFGLTMIVAVRKLWDKKPGLIINKQGIIDNSSGLSAGLVLWTDIEKILIYPVSSQKFLMFIVKNPNHYLNKITNPLKWIAMEINFRFFGSPINISANSLQTNFDELHDLLTEKLKEYKTQTLKQKRKK